MHVNSLSLRSNLFPSFSASEIGTNQRLVPLKSLNSPSFSSNLRFLRKSAQNSSGVGSDDGVIIVDHGSRRKESNLMLNEFVEMFRQKTGYQIVEPAHMVFSLSLFSFYFVLDT
ncbi:sirohydrochlorin ferrochelatase [Trifolium repens]|nr:sirohydrochlorin ferrochelatase [Trifolium repens]